MAIKKFADLANETDSKFNNLKDSIKRAKINERFDDTTHNEQPADEALQYLNKKLDECIDIVNANNTASGSLETRVKTLSAASKSSQALRGDTTTITADQADAITTNSAKTGITTSQANAITTNTAKRDARYIYFPVIANFSGNINTAQFIPLSDGETEGTNAVQRRNNFIAPATGTLHKVFVRSNASLLVGGKGTTLTGRLTKYGAGDDKTTTIGTATVTTGATAVTNTLDFSGVSNNSFVAGDRLLISLQASLNSTKNYYVTAVFKLDQSSLD